jgi:hypothetical protein
MNVHFIFYSLMTVGQKSVRVRLGMKVMYHIFLYRSELCGFDLRVKPGKYSKFVYVQRSEDKDNIEIDQSH